MTQLSIWKDANPTVKVHNPIVFSQLAAMDVTSMRLFLLMLAKWNVEGPIDESIRIHFKELIPNYKSSGAEFKVVCNAIVDLKESIKDIKVEEVVKGVRTFKVMTVIDYLEFSEDRQYIEGRFAFKIREYLKNIKGRFTIAELNEIFTLRSYHSIRLYLIGRSFYEGMPDVKLSIDEFKQIVVGDTESYKEFKFLKRDVITKSINALKKTSAAIVINEKKNGKNVVGLVIKPAKAIKGRNIELDQPSPLSEDLLALFEKFGVNATKPAELLLSGIITEKYITYVFEKFKDSIDSKKGAFIHSAIVGLKYMNEYKLSVKGQIYKPITKPEQKLNFITSFLSESELKEINKDGYDQAIEAMLQDGFFWTEKKGIKGLGKY